LTLRYRKVYRQFLMSVGLRLPLLITPNDGWTATVTDRPRAHGQRLCGRFSPLLGELGMAKTRRGNYMRQVWPGTHSELQMDDDVLGAAACCYRMTGF